ncbi:FAD-dependent thymidylate synthase [Gluconacetobacter johannae DSM 13595]|uniref:Flavin-dependent thymidylate synthase n=1 Tax=Gluconacetobacter johannae TaxID=112140 RepID=A0A7W4P783_9PROT|nr:FAD-dependent thymidylate synthase [Gluconacetobacter johannae]MBB2176670.1 FAD-dependent thymidylate synthase [Gluconacetobacter johannae]GBQ91285.1 FAD-dependent thymidylate synthase [Gluconacetobacter johannae DSM 13595]
MFSTDQQSEIDAARAGWAQTRRTVVPAAEDALYTPLPVLETGFVRLIDYMGGDAAIVQGARVSYGKGTRSTSDDRGLIRYLMRNRHTSPFELAVAKFHVRAPIFVTRQWFRHRTASINEYSARYSVLEKEFYFPRPEDIARQSSSNKQGRGDSLPADAAEQVLALLREDATRCYDHYLEMLNQDEAGNIVDPTRPVVARELARMTLPVNVMTQFYWQINLWNLLHFLRLRADAHAQYEIRAYADAILTLVERWVPQTFEAFRDYMQEAALLSGPALRALRAILAGDGTVDLQAAGLSKREAAELIALLPEIGPRAR